MICPKCHAENPDVNRFCGMCGSRLQETAPADHTPPDNGNDLQKSGTQGIRRPFIVSTTAMADVTAQMLNTRVVLPSPSVASATHSGYVTPLKPRVDDISHGESLPQPESAPVDPNDEPFFATRSASPQNQEGTVHELDLDSPEEQEAEEWLERNVAEHEAHMPPPPTRSTGSILNLSAPVASTHYEEPVTERVVEEEPVRNSFLQFDPPEEGSVGTVSGPSFLGLDEPPSQDYLVEESPSHAGRNLLVLVILAIVGVLGYLEWRASNRGESTNPVDVLHLKLPKKKGQGQVEVAPSSTTSPTTADSASNSGKPDLIAEPNQSATQSSNPAPDSQPPATSAAAGPSPSPGEVIIPPSRTTNQGSAAASSPAPAASANETKPSPVEQQPTTEIAKSVPPATSKPAPLPQSDAPAAGKPTATKPTASKPAAATSAKQQPVPDESAPEADASLNAGAFELQKGKAAGATDDGRMWLWKAVAKGNGEAPVLLADMYLQGNGVAKDCEQAVLLLNAAAKKANPRARTKLGSLYATGQCVAQDRVQAYKWMTSALAANPGSEWIEKNRQQLLNQMTASERKRAAAIQ